MRLIIDADPLVYGAGFAAEVHHWTAVFEDANGELHDLYFSPHPDKGGAKEQLNKFAAEHPELTLNFAERVIVPEPKEFALQAVSTILKGTINAIEKKFGLARDGLVITVLLSGPGNWREELAKVAVYKGNRDAQHKPYHYQAIRDYLVERWGASVISGREADDEVSIIAHQHIAEGDTEGYVVCTIDKDLDQIPGHHYDYKKHVHYEVPAEHAERWFWVQALAGDATDNIPGCYRMGVATAEKLVDRWMDEGQTPKQLWDSVVATYEAAVHKHGDKCPWLKAGRTSREAALETAQLVYMQKEPGKLWEPPK